MEVEIKLPKYVNTINMYNKIGGENLEVYKIERQLSSEFVNLNSNLRLSVPEENKSKVNMDKYKQWGKSIVVVAIILLAAGVPLYMLSEIGMSQVAPIAISDNNAQVGTPGADFIAFEIWHFGQWPTITQLAQMLTGPLIEIGLGFIAPYVVAIASFIMAAISAYGLSASSIIFGLQYWAATASLALNPYVLAGFGLAVLSA